MHATPKLIPGLSFPPAKIGERYPSAVTGKGLEETRSIVPESERPPDPEDKYVR